MLNKFIIPKKHTFLIDANVLIILKYLVIIARDNEWMKTMGKKKRNLTFKKIYASLRMMFYQVLYIDFIYFICLILCKNNA